MNFSIIRFNVLVMIKIGIGQKAGLLSEIIHQEGEVELENLREMSHFSADVFYMALGWLARECRIAFIEKEGKQVVFLL
jgi:hypothetical protein